MRLSVLRALLVLGMTDSEIAAFHKKEAAKKK